MKKQVSSSLHHQFSVPYEHITDIMHKIVSSFNLNIIYVYHNFTISPFHNITVSPKKKTSIMQDCFQITLVIKKINITRINNVMFLHVSLPFLYNGIERLRISMGFDTNNSNISLLNL